LNGAAAPRLSKKNLRHVGALLKPLTCRIEVPAVGFKRSVDCRADMLLGFGHKAALRFLRNCLGAPDRKSQVSSRWRNCEMAL
jgi:hypothetical protein